jgi:nucleoside 2-deoxyribosyltransferase
LDALKVNPFLRHFETEVLPNLMASDMVIVLLTDDGLDSKICLEVGAAVLLDKPLLVLTTNESLVNERLRRVADKVVVVGEKGTWLEEEPMTRINQAIDEFMKDLAARCT